MKLHVVTLAFLEMFNSPTKQKIQSKTEIQNAEFHLWTQCKPQDFQILDVTPLFVILDWSAASIIIQSIKISYWFEF